MKTAAPLLALVLASIAPSRASAQVPVQAPAPTLVAADLRVRKVAYQPDAVTIVSARPDFETMISFAPDERIENVAVGDSTAWQVTPNKHSDLLFVKPIAMNAHTNMAVVTDRRTYLFELRADEGAGPLMYNLRFSYPDVPAPQPATAAAPVVTTQWQASGAAALRPARAYDDGHSVFLYWPKAAALPALLAVDGKGNEEPLTFTARDDYLITDSVPAKVVVRVGTVEAVLVPKTVRPAIRQIAER